MPQQGGSVVDNEWLSALKDGDKVIVAANGWGGFRKVGTVRVTKTQVMVSNAPQLYGEWRYRRSDGTSLDNRGTFLLPYIEENKLHLLTMEEGERVRKALDKLRHEDIEALALGDCLELHAQLTHVWAALEKAGVVEKKGA